VLREAPASADGVTTQHGRELYLIDDKCECSADLFLTGGEKKCKDSRKCGRNSDTKDKPFCVSSGHGCNNDVMMRCQGGHVGDYCDDASCVHPLPPAHTPFHLAKILTAIAVRLSQELQGGQLVRQVCTDLGRRMLHG